MSKWGVKEDFFVRNNYRKVIVYGWTRISEYFLMLSIHIDINIVCILEDMKAHKIGGHIKKGGIPVIPRSSAIDQIEADCIIIADLLQKDKIYKSLLSRTSMPIITDDDLYKS